jgi:hypothetical protein
VEDNPAHLEKILLYCVQHLKKLVGAPRPQMGVERVDVRRVREEKAEKKAGAVLKTEDDNELVNLFGKWLHPLSSLSEFDQFKFMFFQNNYPVEQLPPQLREDIKVILETQWVENKTRRIVTVKK